MTELDASRSSSFCFQARRCATSLSRSAATFFLSPSHSASTQEMRTRNSEMKSLYIVELLLRLSAIVHFRPSLSLLSWNFTF